MIIVDCMDCLGRDYDDPCKKSRVKLSIAKRESSSDPG